MKLHVKTKRLDNIFAGEGQILIKIAMGGW